MEAGFDPFEVLGVPRGANEEQIRAAYRDLVSRYHPDKHRGNPLESLAAAKLVEINRAYSLLSGSPRDASARGAPAAEGPPTSGAGAGARRSYPPATGAPPPRAAGLLRSAVGVVGVALVLRFGLALAGELFALARGAALGLLWILRSGPVLGILVVAVVVLGVRYAIGVRKGPSS